MMEGHVLCVVQLVWEGPDRCVPQVLRGCEDSELQKLHLQRNPALYSFTRQGAGLSVSGAPWHWVRLVTVSTGPRVAGLPGL